MYQDNFVCDDSGEEPSRGATTTPGVNRQRAARVKRLYDAKGGPLLAWLHEERLGRGDTPEQLCAKLGTTREYLGELWRTPEKTQGISADFARHCSAYLGVPPIVVKVLAGQITIVDFIQPPRSEEEVIDCSLRRIVADPVARQLLPASPEELSLAAKRALVLLYAEFLGTDFFGLRWLTGILQWLEPAAQVHFSNATAAKLRAIASDAPRSGTGGQLRED